MNIKIRQLHEADSEFLAVLGRETFRAAFVDNPMMPKAELEKYLDEAFSTANIRTELTDPASTFLLAEIGGVAAGYAKLLAGEREDRVSGDNPIKLKRLYAQQEFLGAGIGGALLKACIDLAAERGHDKIWLTAWENNPRAIAFYRKWGFEQVGLIDFNLGGVILTDSLMTRTLAERSDGAQAASLQPASSPT